MGTWRRRDWLRAAPALGAWAAAPRAAAAAPRGVLRQAFNFAETGFDPPQVSDNVSLVINAHIFEAPLTYALGDGPIRIVPQTAAALPEVSADFRRFVFTLRPGLFFADDPVFGGRPRELTAADQVYSLKRYYDPALKSEHLYQFENAKILGLSELRQAALRTKTPFDYDAPVEGLRVLDRYRFEVRLAEPAPRFIHVFAANGLTGAVAREVVEAYAADLMAHPVGTGPFRLAQWRRASLIVLERNPRYREHLVDGRRVPHLDRIEASIIEESQPRWLAFLNREHDVLELPADFAPVAVPGGELAPYLVQRGVRARRSLGPDVTHTFFNFDDPMVGGYQPVHVALRRAIALAYDNHAENRLVRRGQGVPAMSMLAPNCYGYDPALRSELGASDPARAKALLDMFGYVDRDGDGWRERPDGSPLHLRLATVDDQRGRALSELWARRMTAVGLRMSFEPGSFGSLIKRSLAGQLMMWGFTWSAGAPDADFFLGLAYGPNAAQSNDARFKLPAFDRLYEQQRLLPDGPERLALMHRARNLMLAQMPYIAHSHRIVTDLTQPDVRGFVRHPFRNDYWLTADRG